MSKTTRGMLCLYTAYRLFLDAHWLCILVPCIGLDGAAVRFRSRTRGVSYSAAPAVQPGSPEGDRPQRLTLKPVCGLLGLGFKGAIALHVSFGQRAESTRCSMAGTSISTDYATTYLSSRRWLIGRPSWHLHAPSSLARSANT